MPGFDHWRTSMDFALKNHSKVWSNVRQHRDCRRLRRVWERHRNRPQQKHRLRLWQLNMNTNEISEYLNRDLICSTIFYGVYLANKIPILLQSLPALIVCYAGTSSRPKAHWIVLYDDKNYRGEYLDSMNRFQTKWFKPFLDVNCIRRTGNEKQLQSVISKFCGHIWIFYCLYHYREVDVCKVAKMFNKDTNLDDSIVYNLVCKF